jgi:hypothetical protein
MLNTSILHQHQHISTSTHTADSLSENLSPIIIDNPESKVMGFCLTAAAKITAPSG